MSPIQGIHLPLGSIQADESQADHTTARPSEQGKVPACKVRSKMMPLLRSQGLKDNRALRDEGSGGCCGIAESGSDASELRP